MLKSCINSNSLVEGVSSRKSQLILSLKAGRKPDENPVLFADAPHDQIALTNACWIQILQLTSSTTKRLNKEMLSRTKSLHNKMKIKCLNTMSFFFSKTRAQRAKCMEMKWLRQAHSAKPEWAKWLRRKHVALSQMKWNFWDKDA